MARLPVAHALYVTRQIGSITTGVSGKCGSILNCWKHPHPNGGSNDRTRHIRSDRYPHDPGAAPESVRCLRQAGPGAQVVRHARLHDYARRYRCTGRQQGVAGESPARHARARMDRAARKLQDDDAAAGIKTSRAVAYGLFVRPARRSISGIRPALIRFLRDHPGSRIIARPGIRRRFFRSRRPPATAPVLEISMDTIRARNARRRTLLKAMAGLPGLGLAGGLISLDASAQAGGKAAVNLQLGWLPGNNQIGEVAAKQLGYFAQESLEVTIQPGGPNIDGVAIVASGKYEMGQVSSSPSLMLAASQDLPVKCFATGLQQHPYTFFSLKKKPVNSAKDMVGKKVGIQATGVILLRALLAKNNIPESNVEIVTIGADMSPLLTGQVDVVTGWQTNVTALKPLGPDRVDLRLWDAGVRLYALPYYATVKTIQTRPDVLQKFLRATARGYAYTNANRDAATDLLIKEYPNLTRNDEKVGIDAMMGYAFNDLTKTNGWGTMDPGVWQDQISLYSQLGQFSKRTPKLDEVMTMEILNSTRDARAKV